MQITKAQANAIVSQWLADANALNLKPGTKKRAEMMVAWFSGMQAALNAAGLENSPQIVAPIMYGTREPQIITE
jgi:hypothetical protein